MQTAFAPEQFSFVDTAPEVLPPSDKNELLKVPQKELEKLRWGLLKDSLAELIDERTSDYTRTHVLQWICSDDEEYPYSFINCVKAWGAREGEPINPIEFRAEMFRLYRIHQKRMARKAEAAMDFVETTDIAALDDEAMDEDVEDRIIYLGEDDDMISSDSDMDDAELIAQIVAA